MAGGPTSKPVIDANWPELLSLAVHEIRNPLSVVAGYIRMLLKEQAGPIPKQQRSLLEKAEDSCTRMSQVLGEASVVAHIEKREVVFKRGAIDLGAILADVIHSLPPLPSHKVTVELLADGDARVQGDKAHLKDALAGIILALRRELVTSDLMTVRVERDNVEDKPIVRITVGEAVRMSRLLALTRQELGTFDEYARWRGGNGLSLPYARRVIEAHGGSLLAPVEDDKAVAVVSIPTA